MGNSSSSEAVEMVASLRGIKDGWLNGETLLTKKELGSFFKMDPDNAQKFCARHDVLPINIGLGKVARLRWIGSQVINLLTILQASSTKPQKEFRPRRKGDAHILGRSVRELYTELSCT